MLHLTVRVAWHDRAWNGAVRDHPDRNAFCLALERVRESRDDVYEEAIAGRHWACQPWMAMRCRHVARNRCIHERSRFRALIASPRRRSSAPTVGVIEVILCEPLTGVY